jgi:dienelactone hydrolase
MPDTTPTIRAIRDRYDALAQMTSPLLTRWAADGRTAAYYRVDDGAFSLTICVFEGESCRSVREVGGLCAPLGPPVWDGSRGVWWASPRDCGVPQDRVTAVPSNPEARVLDVELGLESAWVRDCWDDGLLLAGGCGQHPHSCEHATVPQSWAVDTTTESSVLLGCSPSGTLPVCAASASSGRWAALVVADGNLDAGGGYHGIAVEVSDPGAPVTLRVPDATQTWPKELLVEAGGITALCKADPNDRWETWALGVPGGSTTRIAATQDADVEPWGPGSGGMVLVRADGRTWPARPAGDGGPPATIGFDLPGSGGCAPVNVDSPYDRYFMHSAVRESEAGRVIAAVSSCFAPTTLAEVGPDHVLSFNSGPTKPGDLTCRDVVVRARDGLEFHAILARSQEKFRGRGVVMLHGGPQGEFTHAYDPLTLLFVRTGYAVLRANIRGSDGRGRHLRDGAASGWAFLQTSLDVGAATAFLRREAGCVEVCVYGVSLGGVQALHAAADPNCGINAVATWGAPTDFAALSRDGDAMTAATVRAWLGDPDAAAETWVAASPITRARELTCPALLMVGGRDPVCPPGQASAFADAAVQAEGNVRVAVFDSAHRLDIAEVAKNVRCQAVEFFESCLAGGGRNRRGRR